MAITISWLAQAPVMIVTSTENGLQFALEQVDYFLNDLFSKLDAPVAVIHDMRALNSVSLMRSVLSKPCMSHSAISQSVYVPAECFSIMQALLLKFRLPRPTHHQLCNTLQDAALLLSTVDPTLPELSKKLNAYAFEQLNTQESLPDPLSSAPTLQKSSAKMLKH
jgi:hypothetical protein